MIVRVQFLLGYGLSSWGIGYFGAMRLSHMDIQMPNGDWLGARDGWYEPAQGPCIPPGVQIRPRKYYEPVKRRIVLQKAVEDSVGRKFYDLACKQIGKPYDWRAIWNFAIPGVRDWRDPSEWFCSELGIWLGEETGIIPKLTIAANRVMPGTAAVAYCAAGFEVVPGESA